MQKRRTALGAILLTLVFTACDNGTTAPPPVVEPPSRAVAATVPHDSLFYGRTTRVAFTDSVAFPDSAYRWSSSDTTIAVVNDSGQVLGVGTGVVHIRVSRPGAADSVRLRVMLQDAGRGVLFAKGSEVTQATTYCALSLAGAVYCRPDATVADTAPVFERMPGAAGVVYNEVSTSFYSHCARTNTGKVHCWGRNRNLSMGTLRAVNTDTGPFVIPTALRFSSMRHGGHSTTCGIEQGTQTAFCWGHGDMHQHGRSERRNDSMPRPTQGVAAVQQVAPGNVSLCVLDMDGAAFCSGLSAYAVGTGPEYERAETLLPVLTTTRFSHISVADNFQCALALDQRSWCWGSRSEGSLGRGVRTDADPRFAPVAGDHRFLVVRPVTPRRACGITTDNDLYCWGPFAPQVISERLGDAQHVPYRVASGVKFTDLSGPSCGITVQGRTMCW